MSNGGWLPAPTGRRYGERIHPLRLTALGVLAGLMLCAGCASTKTGAPTTAQTTTTAPPTTSSLQWGSPVRLSSTSLAAVSCTVGDFCMVIDANGDAYRYNGSSWGSAVALVGQPGVGQAPAVSCTSSSFCMAIAPGSDDVQSWDGSSWSGPVPVAVTTLQGVSCVGTAFCAAVDGEGNAYLFQSGSWRRGSGDWGGISALSCVASSFCVSVSGGISQFDGASWTQPQEYGATSGFTGVSCPSATFCMAVTTLGQFLAYSSSGWTAPVQFEPSAAGGVAVPAGVSCWAPSACVAVDNAGNVLVFTGTWSSAKGIDSGRSLTGVSCTADMCVAVDNAGYAVIGRR